MLLLIIVFSLVGSVFSLIGGFILLLKKRWTEDFSLKLVSFAAGVLLATAFFDLLPEALESSDGNPNLFLPVFLAMIAFFFLERSFFWFHHHFEDHGLKPSLYLILLGDTVHNFVDGVVIAASFFISVPLGILTSFAVAAHEVPQEIADFTIMITQGLSRKRALVLNFVSSCATLVGALLTYLAFGILRPYLWVIIAAAGGMFIYIATADLIPELHKAYQKGKGIAQAFFFVLGILVTFVLVKGVHFLLEG